ncbi:MAG: hypothetical protein AAGE61_13285 [Pseudomonadota bacterium]
MGVFSERPGLRATATVIAGLSAALIFSHLALAGLFSISIEASTTPVSADYWIWLETWGLLTAFLLPLGAIAAFVLARLHAGLTASIAALLLALLLVVTGLASGVEKPFPAFLSLFASLAAFSLYISLLSLPRLPRGYI